MSNISQAGNFSVELLKHSTYKGKEALTWLCTYERFIHAEVMTHRFSRNASSSRAIPLARMLEWIDRDPAMPLHYGSNRSGMQSGAEIEAVGSARETILASYKATRVLCQYLHTLGLHKEVINRYTEPWGWITVVMTMGHAQFFNFLNLRVHRAAHPNIQRLAINMARTYKSSTPIELKKDQWHIPFTDGIDALSTDLIWSVARSAWASYNAPGKVATFEDAKRRHDDCVQYKHMTPCEHQLCAGDTLGVVPGYTSYRMMLPNESASTFDWSRLEEWGDKDFLIGD